MENKKANECKYRLPCGWCDKRDRECKIATDTTTQLTSTVPIDETGTTDLTAIKKLCCNCDTTDGMWYTSNPPKVKCLITGKFRFYDDVCDCDVIMGSEQQ